ncbi:uncharacterized protein LOC62_08G009845 [Vanrija pseudolonga]|uniref:Uncharacterized protein n=1 Tax=Vanrija pseudolonga TaxID=143232 RepID=A0AAF1BML0_9TREE|nr:hypothetical protein LOC62_08G009845 [Vanrija pseudolonga]
MYRIRPHQGSGASARSPPSALVVDLAREHIESIFTTVMKTSREHIESIFTAYVVHNWIDKIWLASLCVPVAQALLVHYKRWSASSDYVHIKSKDDQALVSATIKTVRTYNLEQARQLLSCAILFAGYQLTLFVLPTLLKVVLSESWDDDKVWGSTRYARPVWRPKVVPLSAR